MVNVDPDTERPTVDFTGLKIAAALAPLLLLFIYLGKDDMGLTIFIVLGVVVFSVKTHWNLHKNIWFWMTVAFIVALHSPLFFIVRWPHGSTPGVFYGIPVAFADFLVVSKILDLAEKVLSKGSDPKPQD